MREAAATLDAVHDKYPQYGRSWTPALLRNEALHVESEENDAAEREAWTEELARVLLSLISPTASLENLGEFGTGCFRDAARELIDAGWCKS
jgi:hypothetical protein